MWDTWCRLRQPPKLLREEVRIYDYITNVIAIPFPGGGIPVDTNSGSKEFSKVMQLLGFELKLVLMDPSSYSGIST
jgi:hypothetical protein